MKIYLVGGAVRDQLLGLPVTERDYVVVGASPEEMIAQGFKPVGKEFPVFLHPETREEYALARTERKIAKGYKGFEFYAAPEVTLEEDLKRRDLTINAIAETVEGDIIDPYHGQEDIKNKILRHVSLAFAEDPVRILRLARFAARFADFRTHPETQKLMSDMVAAGEVNALVAERVWQEFSKALNEQQPERFFQVLNECGALVILFPEISAKFPVVIEKLRNAARLTKDQAIRFAVMCLDIDTQQIQNLCDRYRVPNELRELAVLVSRNFGNYQRVLEFDAKQLLQFLETLDAFRRPQRFKQFLMTCEMSAEVESKNKSELLTRVYQIANKISAQPFVAAGMVGKEVADAMTQARIEAIRKKL